MLVQCANSRPKYTDNEISKMFHDIRIIRNESISDLANKYNVNEEIIEFIDQGKCKLSMQMFRIASDYLGISHQELSQVLFDDDTISCRGSKNAKAEAVIDIVNILF